MDSRLDRFRKYFERLDPSSRQPGVLSNDLYAEPPGRATGEQLASRFQLAPSSSQLIVGGVGTGKSTQLSRAAEALRSTEDTQAVYVDVSRHHDLEQNLDGVLVILAGLALANRIGKQTSDEVKAAVTSFRQSAYGHREFVEYPSHGDDDYDNEGYDHEPGYWHNYPGIISPPLPPLPPAAQERVKALKTLKMALPDGIRHFVILFDSLDRLDSVEAFRKAVIDDARALKQAEIGLAVVGPMSLLYGSNRPVVDIFEQINVVPAFDVVHDLAAHGFLLRVIAKRTDEKIVRPEVGELLVRASGGLLRDVLQLTRSAVEEAFIAGADTVTPDHVMRAVDDFGRTMMFGLGTKEIDILERLHKYGTFVPINDNDIALLVSRRVIEYQGPTKRYAVHPAIEPLLASLRGTK